MSNLTVRAQSLIQQSQQLAYNYKNPIIEPIHLLHAMLNDKEGVTDILIKKANGNINIIKQKMKEALDSLPKIQSGDPAQNISRDFNNVLLAANASLKKFGDEFVSPEHFLFAL